MGRRTMTGGVAPAGQDRIQLTFTFEGVRYRPTLPIVPNEANLRQARQQLARIRQSIANGAFCFGEDFPEFRHLKQVPDEGSPRTCNDVFDAFLTHCRSRLEKSDLANVTVATYRRVLNSAWRPWIGGTRFLSVRYSTLVEIADRVARQHGHSIRTMLRVYAAWAEGMVESDVAAIKQAMTDRPAVQMQAMLPAPLVPFAIRFADSFCRADPSD
jgi:Arm DNA-binding domain